MSKCKTIVDLKAYMRDQDMKEIDNGAVLMILAQLLDDEIVDSASKYVAKAMIKCEEEWHELMEMQDLVVDEAPILEVLRLAKLAQTFKSAIANIMQDDLHERAIEIHSEEKSYQND